MRRWATSTAAAFLALALVNSLEYLLRRVPCCDWTMIYGLPFGFVVVGGFGGLRFPLWRGAIADAVFILALGGVIDWFRRHRSCSTV